MAETKTKYRDVYEAANGPIKKGLVCHHLNGQHSDNRLENLILLSRGFHNCLHRLMRHLPLETLFRIGEGLMDYVIAEQRKIDGR